MQYTSNFISGKNKIIFNNNLCFSKSDISPFISSDTLLNDLTSEKQNIITPIQKLRNAGLSLEQSLYIFIRLFSNIDTLTQMYNKINENLIDCNLIAAFDGIKITRNLEIVNENTHKKKYNLSFLNFFNKSDRNKLSFLNINTVEYSSTDFVFKSKETNIVSTDHSNSFNYLPKYQYQKVYKSKLLCNLIIDIPTYDYFLKMYPDIKLNSLVTNPEFITDNKKTNKFVFIDKLYNISNEIQKEISLGKKMVLTYMGPTIINIDKTSSEICFSVYETEFVVFESTEEASKNINLSIDNSSNYYSETEDIDNLSNSIAFCAKKNN